MTAPPPAPAPLLTVRNLTVTYGAARAVDGVALDVYPGEIVTIIGGNGAGKSSTLRALSGVREGLQRSSGRIELDGRAIDRWSPERIARLGLAHVPEGRRVFPAMTVEENLTLGAFRRRRDHAGVAADLEAAYERFRVLGDRRSQLAGLLSGGEQQMLAIGRGLMARPRCLLLDEPSLGLAPRIVESLFEVIADLAAEGLTALLVEQLASVALTVADRAYVLESGRVVTDGPADEVARDPKVIEAYLGA